MMNDLASEMDDHEELATEDQAAFDDFDDATKEDNSTKTWSDVDDGESIPGEKIFFDIASGNKGRYMRDREKIDLAKAQTLARLFQRKNKDYEFSMRGMRSGRLDTGKLAEAKQHVPTIYERVGQVKTNKICVGVLIDESGSMGGEEIEKARQAAIFLNEVFKKMSGVELFIYGHSADIRFSGATEINVYKEPGKNTDMYALGSVHARSENRDGTAILATARRIRKQTKNNGILFVLSDGGPCARGYHGASAIADVRKKVHEAENLGFQVIQIAINTCVPSADMFNHYITMTDIKNLPKDMVTYMSRKVDHLIKERVFI
jgi:cobalamin biosynthesis protein CobT